MVINEPTALAVFNKLKALFEGGIENRCSSLMSQWYKIVVKCESLEMLVNGLKDVVDGFEKIFNTDGVDPEHIWVHFLLLFLMNTVI